MIRAPFFRLGVAAVVGALAVTALPAPADAAVDRGTVQGTYTTDSGVAISSALVSAYSADYDFLGDDWTDNEGRFTLRNVTAGSVKLQFQNNGVQQWAHDATDFDGATEFTLAADQTLTVDESRLPTGTITGVVKEQSGEPAYYSAVVHPTDGSGNDSYSFPDADGRYSADVLPGQYKVSFGRGATEQWAVQKVDEASAATFTVAAGQRVEVSDTFLPSGTIGGKLTTADGTPLVEANVVLHRPYDPDGDDSDGRVADTYTDENGDYTFADALPGNYRISFTTGDSGPRQWLRGTIDPARATVYTVVVGERTTADASQMRTSTVQGRLTDSAGKPVADYAVQIRPDTDDSNETYDTFTGPDGRWRVGGVYPASYLVSFQNQGTSRQQWAYGKNNADEATRIEVSGGDPVTVNDTWLPGATLVVTAVDAGTGAPVSDFCGYLSSVDAGGCTSGSELTLADLPGGEHLLGITTGGRSFYLGADDRPVKLTPGETTTVTVPLQQGGKAAITVTDAATGAPVEDTCFVLKTPGTGGLGDGYGNCTNANGRINTQATAPGTYQVFAVAPEPYGHQWVGTTGGTGDQREAARVTIRAGKITKAPAVLLDKAATVTGTVSGADGPIPNANVAYSAWDYGAGPSHDTDADKDGRYTLDRLGPYAWPLVFTAQDYPRQWSGGTGNRFQAQLVPLTAGTSTTYDMTMKHSSTVTGVVRIAPGVPADQWRLNAVNAVTGDAVGVVDSYGTENGAYDMPLAGSQQIKIGWSLSDEDGFWQDGWYDNAPDMASATKVSVPKTGSKKLDLVVGRP